MNAHFLFAQELAGKRLLAMLPILGALSPILSLLTTVVAAACVFYTYKKARFSLHSLFGVEK